MTKITKFSLLTIGVLLLIIGIGNMIDDSRVLTYDITAALSGIGFIVLAGAKRV